MRTLTNAYLDLAAALGALWGWTYTYRMQGIGEVELVCRHPFFGEYVFPPNSYPT